MGEFLSGDTALVFHIACIFSILSQSVDCLLILCLIWAEQVGTKEKTWDHARHRNWIGIKWTEDTGWCAKCALV